MQFLKCVKVALLVSGTAFAISSLPAVRLANERVDVQLNRAQVFSGEMRDLSGAYLAIAGMMSLSLGITGFSLAAWRQTGSRLKATKLTVEELETLVKQREQQLQSAQLAPARLQQSGLNAFIEDDFFFAATPNAKQLPASQTAPLHTAPLHNVAASRVIKQTEQQRSPVAAQAARPVQYQRQLSPSQAFQLQAVQAQLQQQSHQAQQTVVANRETANSGGFTVINPYQVQSIPQASRQRSAVSSRRMA